MEKYNLQVLTRGKVEYDDLAEKYLPLVSASHGRHILLTFMFIIILQFYLGSVEQRQNMALFSQIRAADGQRLICQYMDTLACHICY